MIVKIKPQQKKSRKSPKSNQASIPNFIHISLLIALAVWLLLAISLDSFWVIGNMIKNWEISLTMVLGSMVAGGTSLGGGAVAFPVLTKVLSIPPDQAKVFALAIQTIGMGAASITIIAMKTKLEWRLIRWTSLGGIPGIFISSLYLSPLLPASIVKISFSMMISSFAMIFLFLMNNKQQRNYYPKLVVQENWQKIIFLGIGFFGGLISGMVGSGMDIFAFAAMILLFDRCEKISTATSVVLMAFNSLVGFFLHNFVIKDFVPPVSNYWLAAVPVVVIGAPLGAIICNYLNKNTISQILVILVAIDLISSILLIPTTQTVITTGLMVFSLFTTLYYFMYRSRKFLVKRKYFQY